MSYHEKLQAEIATKVDGLAADGSPLKPAWIAHAICNDHKAGLAKAEDDPKTKKAARQKHNVEFWMHGGYRTVRREAGTYITKKYGGEGTGTAEHRQLTLPGYEYVQTHYVVERDGDEIAVPAHELSDDEIDARISTFKAYGAAYLAHADELKRFKSLRRQSGAA